MCSAIHRTALVRCKFHHRCLFGGDLYFGFVTIFCFLNHRRATCVSNQKRQHTHTHTHARTKMKSQRFASIADHSPRRFSLDASEFSGGLSRSFADAASTKTNTTKRANIRMVCVVYARFVRRRIICSMSLGTTESLA